MLIWCWCWWWWYDQWWYVQFGGRRVTTLSIKMSTSSLNPTRSSIWSEALNSSEENQSRFENCTSWLRGWGSVTFLTMELVIVLLFLPTSRKEDKALVQIQISTTLLYQMSKWIFSFCSMIGGILRIPQFCVCFWFWTILELLWPVRLYVDRPGSPVGVQNSDDASDEFQR